MDKQVITSQLQHRAVSSHKGLDERAICFSMYAHSIDLYHPIIAGSRENLHQHAQVICWQISILCIHQVYGTLEDKHHPDCRGNWRGNGGGRGAPWA